MAERKKKDDQMTIGLKQLIGEIQGKVLLEEKNED